MSDSSGYVTSLDMADRVEPGGVGGSWSTREYMHANK